MKKIVVFILILFSLFLVSCGKKDTSDKLEVKFSDYILTLPKEYTIAFNEKTTSKIANATVLHQYVEKKSSNKFRSSLTILRFDGDYPKDEKDFFSVIVDKFTREIVGSQILKIGDFKVDGTKVYYFKYKVSDNMFDEANQTVYYGVQAYLFNKDRKTVYIISYVSLDEKKVDEMISIIKSLKVNK